MFQKFVNKVFCMLLLLSLSLSLFLLLLLLLLLWLWLWLWLLSLSLLLLLLLIFPRLLSRLTQCWWPDQVARSGYTEWHEAIFGKENSIKMLPIPEEKLKSHWIALFKAGYAPSTIMQVNVNGLCTWVRECCFSLCTFK